MSIRGFRSNISSAALQAQFDRGVGAGHGADYRPPLTTENFDSLGHAGKWLCHLTNRYRHDFSEEEEGVFYGILQDPHVTDARENYPLAVGLTEAICKALGLRHPRSTGDGKPLIPFTTDLLVTRRHPPRHVAIIAKQRRNPSRIPLKFRYLLRPR